ncbi:hypothetical protein [Clostridium intestinale]|uniref:hypothetical protein n=1 Tax=Clostridium intestinale TaxID=36845 RepID=UPI0028F07365|nr:hypothetical protein [Clostridium intestinale]
MIKIHITDDRIENVKDIFRKWFFRKGNMEKFYNVVKSDKLLREIIFDNESDYKKWLKCFVNSRLIANKKEECRKVLERFFFSRFDDDYNLKKYVVDGQSLKAETKEFFERKYENFRERQATKIVRELNIKVCPYCNRNYIELYNYIDSTGKKKCIFKGELDHYFSKSRYPQLAISIFNLIPCCKICNHEKLDNDLLTFNPYFHDEKESYRFKLETLNENDIYDITFEEEIVDLKEKINDSTYVQGNSDNFKILIEHVNDSYKDIISNSKTIFRLEKKYNNSKGYVKELLKKRYIYNDRYAEILSENFSDVFASANEVKRTVFSNELNGDSLNERPLSKLTYDILKQLEIL